MRKFRRACFCPADPLVRWVWWTYPYSYRINRLALFVGQDGHQYATTGGLKRGRVRNPSHKVLAIDTAAPFGHSQGEWEPRVPFISPGMTVLSVRHHRDEEKHESPAAGWGNVLFADGHADTLPRRLSMESRYYDLLLP